MRADPQPAVRDDDRERIARGLAAMAGEEQRLRLQVVGGCMAPTIRSGDELEVGARTPMPGDVVAVFDRRGRVRVHRLLGYRPGWHGWRPSLALVTRADNARAIDAPAPRSRLIGRVEGIAGRGRLTVGLGDRLTAAGGFVAGSARWLWRRIRHRQAARLS